MKIKEITSQFRRDFKAIYECQACSHEQEGEGYDDAYFHQTVIPDMKCKLCSKSTNDLGIDYRPLSTKYPDGMQV